MLSTEPIGSIPRPEELIEMHEALDRGEFVSPEAMRTAEGRALSDTLVRMAETGSPVITDGEQRKPSFLTYPIAEARELGPPITMLRFADGHERRLPTWTARGFHYARYAQDYLRQALAVASVPVKQAVIAPSALSLMYPPEGIAGYSKEQFLGDLLREAECDVRACFELGADSVQIDFTEARYCIKSDPTLSLLEEFITINNLLLDRFSNEDRSRIGIHTCPGGDCDTTHSAEVDYAYLLPALFRLRAGRFYLQLASESESERLRVLRLIAANAESWQRIFVGVVNPLDPRIESVDEVTDRILEAASIIPVSRLGTTDDCGFAPFADDRSTSRDVAFEKIRVRVMATKKASEKLGV